MGIYLYQNVQTGEIKEIEQGMNECHVYTENGVEYKRIFTNPQAVIDGKINDVFSEREFLDKTAKKRGTFGEAMDYSKEISMKREQLIGTDDPIKLSYLKEYEKSHHGLKHPEQKKMEANARFKDLGIRLD